MPENQNTYCQAALFRCNCCNYEAEIYFNDEFLKESEEGLCENCGKEGHYKFDSILINRDDLDGIVLHPQFASLPDDKNKCSSCSGIEKISWKEVVVKCIKCSKDAMYFDSDTEGKNIKLYKEWCIDWAKPAHPDMMFTDERGHVIYYVNGMLSRISAS